MKQHITQEQWEELVEIGKANKWNYTIEPLSNPPSIGQMIEFLGDDLKEIENENNEKKEKYPYYRVVVCKNKETWEWNRCPELCDALWLACKYKLNGKT